MATINKEWDENTPPGTEALSNGDDRIREFKGAVGERLQNGGHLWEDGTEATSGRHACGVDGELGNAGEWNVFAEDGTTKVFTIDEDNTTVSLPQNYDLDVGTGALKGVRRSTISAAIPSAVGYSFGIVYVNLGASMTLVGTQMFCFTAPSGGGLSVEVRKLSTAWAATPGDANSTVMLSGGSPANALTVASGAFTHTKVTTGSSPVSIVGGGVNVVNSGEGILFKVISLNSADGVVVALEVTRTE